jgi:hypothetical protein
LLGLKLVEQLARVFQTSLLRERAPLLPVRVQLVLADLLAGLLL